MPKIERVEFWLLRAPIARPIANSFGILKERSAVFLRITSDDGCRGWGEVFCNFPQVGAEHRFRLLESIFAPMLAGQSDDPAVIRLLLEQKTRRMALQCGEPGPFAQIIAGVDQALWDIAGRRARMPLWKLLGGKSGRVAVYASGIGPDDVEASVIALHDAGHRAFKLKVGFDPVQDLRNLKTMRSVLGEDAVVMTDANQAWSPEVAIDRILALAPFRPHWIEEPIPADHSAAEWQAVAAKSRVPLAAGENLRGEDAFVSAIDRGYLAFVQPDVGKWGGVSGCRDVAAHGTLRNVVLCPHWFGGAVGLAASIHVAAACGSPSSFAEVDVTQNDLRDAFLSLSVIDGHVTLSNEIGIGIVPNTDLLSRFSIHTISFEF